MNEDPATEASKRIAAALAPYPRSQQIAAVQHNLLMEELQGWVNRDLVLERNDCSRLHKLIEAGRAGLLTDSKFTRTDPDTKDTLGGVTQTFVVKHDWARAFENAEGIADEFKLPYDLCAFEFRISGKTVIAVAVEVDEDRQFTAFMELGELWCGFNVAEESESKATRFVFHQIRAICIALDAEVASHSVVRAPARLNEKRAKRGKAPLLDFHIIDLARKHRISNPGHNDGGTKKRLHFRRGHWRHFETSKTWVKWCMVGNPDLGFISKHYSL